jgi:uncharacterized protein (UPF0210 family)
MLQRMKGSIMSLSSTIHAREREMMETLKLRKGTHYAQGVQYAAISLAIADVAFAASKMPQPLAERLVREHREAVLLSIGLLSHSSNPTFTEKDAELIDDIHTIYEARMETFNQVFSALSKD